MTVTVINGTPETIEDEDISAVRAFNGFYTNTLGVLRRGLLDTPYSLTEARIIFELAQRERCEVLDLRRMLEIDSGYLSHILARFAADGLISRERSEVDGRRQTIALTERGRESFELLDARSVDENRTLLAGVSAEDRRRLLGAMRTIQDVLAGAPRSNGFVLRAPEPGEYGWVVQRHGARYADEYGWDQTFEALVARIVADFVEGRDPRREQAWIAEVDGDPAGCVFCVRRDETTAQLRLLLVEPSARGMGIGSRLVEECIRFARRSGYRGMTLWTNDVLGDARRIYERAGFQLVEEERHHSFGKDLVGQNWYREL